MAIFLVFKRAVDNRLADKMPTNNILFKGWRIDHEIMMGARLLIVFCR